MKILYLTSKMYQGGVQSMLYYGLKEMHQEVIDYPFMPRYHCAIEDGLVVAKDESGKIIGKEQEGGRIQIEGEKVPLNKWQCIINESKNYPTELDLDSYDQIIVTALKYDNMDLINTVLKKASDRTSFLDAEDNPFLQGIISKTKTYFKTNKLTREKLKTFYNEFSASYIYQAYSYTGGNKQTFLPRLPSFIENMSSAIWLPQLGRHKNLYGLNYTIIPHEFKKTTKAYSERTYDISFIASWKSSKIKNNTSPRKQFADYLEQFCKKNNLSYFISVQPGAVSYPKYIEILQDSKLFVSLPGTGFDVVRYWEASLYGSCLISPELPIEIRNNFTDMESAIFFNSTQELERKIKTALESITAEVICKEGQRQHKEYHTPQKRAEYVLSTITRDVT